MKIDWVILIPFVFIIGDALSFFGAVFIELDEDYENLSFYLSQITGHSLLGGLFMLYFIDKFGYCSYSKVVVITLMVLNTFNLLNKSLNLMYYPYYMAAIMVCGTVLALLKWKEAY